jgi:MFS transporter, Spinster family, sphingosine-1-phosphate transporter
MAGDREAAKTGAWGLLTLLTAINVLNFVDRQLLSSFANFIKPDLGLTDTQFGLLTGLFFIIFYAVAGLFMGVLADRMNRSRLIAGAIVLWSLLTAASGAAKGFASMAVPRALIGIGESALTPTALSLLADKVPQERLGLAAGLYYMGVPIGAGASLLIAGLLGPTLGWRNCFYLLGIAGLVLAAAMLLFPDARIPQSREVRPSFGDQMRALSGALKQSPALALTMIGGVSIHFAVGAAAFDQLWFVQERGFERAEIATIAGIITVCGGVAGNIFGGLVGDWWQKNFNSGRPMLLFWMMLLLGPFAILFRIVPPESPLIYIGLGVGIFQLSAFYGPAMSTIQELSPPAARATITAFYILCANAIGLGVGISVTGILVSPIASRRCRSLCCRSSIYQPFIWRVSGSSGIRRGWLHLRRIAHVELRIMPFLKELSRALH